MLPKSYDRVSEETKQTVQLFIAHASGFLKGKGQSDEEVRITMDDIEKEAIRETIETEVKLWKRRHHMCTAEQFVRHFAVLVWETVVGDDREEGRWPYDFNTPGEEGPLSTEFLNAIEAAEREARESPHVKKEGSPQSNEERSSRFKKEQSPQIKKEQAPEVKKEQSPDDEQNLDKLPLCTEPAREQPATLCPGLLNSRWAPMPCESGNKRKNADAEAETETEAPKRRRGNDGRKVPSGPTTQLSTHSQSSVAPLTEVQVQQMNAGLMEAIWETRIYDGDNDFHYAGVFAVKIPKEKAEMVLGHNIRVVRKLLWDRWHPLRLYTCDLGHALQVGLWVLKSESREQVEEVVRYKSEELYNLLRFWSCHVRGSGYQTLAAYLRGYLEHGLRRRIH